ncbi:hypothetical protein NKH94_30460 [Mesorhizobium australicum]|uniref:hypothetical protein n=1 Tax=Mesorhizobium australicum TaxID=536018 RepID=UPI0033373A59
MTRAEIVEALESKGIPVAGVDKNKAIGTIMWRMRDQFVNLPGWGYWPWDEDFERAGYKAPQKQTDVKEPPPSDLAPPGSNLFE